MRIITHSKGKAHWTFNTLHGAVVRFRRGWLAHCVETGTMHYELTRQRAVEAAIAR